MRLWTLHPSLLDSKGLVALWREALGAQAALHGLTQGYNKHPQLERWRGQLDFFQIYLRTIYYEAEDRGYKFDKSKILDYTNDQIGTNLSINVSIGQVKFELEHLMNKVSVRDEKWFFNKIINRLAEDIPLQVDQGINYDWLVGNVFTIDYGNANIESWEKIK